MKKKIIVLKFLVILSVLFALILIACSSNKLNANMPAEERMKVAIKMFEKKHYLDAKTQFRIITLSHSGSTIADKAQFYLAECHFYLKEYILAASEYQRLIKTFPNSEYVDDAKYKLGLSYYKLSPKYSLDQEYTLKAIQEFQEFLEDYHNSPLAPEVQEKLVEARTKLAHKVYSAAEQYRKMGICKSAIIYYDLVLERYYDSKYAPKALYWSGECYRKLNEYKQALDIFQEFVTKYPKNELAQKANQRIKELKEKVQKQAKTADNLKTEGNDR